MNKWLGRGAVVIALSLLGSDQISAGADAHDIEVSSLPITQQVITSLVPLFGGKRNKIIMDQVCLYVSGKQSLDKFDTFFTSKGIEVKQLASQDSGFSYLASASKADLTTACAAFIASTFFTEEALIEGAESKPDDPQLAPKLLRLTPLAVVTVNMLAGLLAAHQGEVFTSLDSCKSVLRRDFVSQSADFIRRTLNGNFVLADFVGNQTENGFFYTFANGNTRLNLYDETWLGEGKVMGTRYVVLLRNIAPDATGPK
ncbi:hypothetical protein PUG81_01885 [Erwiniaceae bacterium L1_54_6]|nr:hypothetical protein [Erwiniaceae bacterium L1_54_6]